MIDNVLPAEGSQKIEIFGQPLMKTWGSQYTIFLRGDLPHPHWPLLLTKFAVFEIVSYP